MQGVLKGYDQCINVVLDDSFERVFSLKEPVEAVELGLYIVRGDNMCVCASPPSARLAWILISCERSSVIGEVPADVREQVLDDQTRAAPLKPLVH